MGSTWPMKELPEEDVEAAAASQSQHQHDGVDADDGTLFEHLRDVHSLEVPTHLSTATQQGLHDRLHDTTSAAED